MYHLLQFNDVDWKPHPTIPGVMTKVFEGRDTNPQADVLLAQVLPGGTLPWHVHELASETAYIVQGAGVLLCAPDSDHRDTASRNDLALNSVATIQAGVWHSVVNAADVPLILYAFHTPPTL